MLKSGAIGNVTSRIFERQKTRGRCRTIGELKSLVLLVLLLQGTKYPMLTVR